MSVAVLDHTHQDQLRSYFARHAGLTCLLNVTPTAETLLRVARFTSKGHIETLATFDNGALIVQGLVSRDDNFLKTVFRSAIARQLLIKRVSIQSAAVPYALGLLREFGRGARGLEIDSFFRLNLVDLKTSKDGDARTLVRRPIPEDAVFLQEWFTFGRSFTPQEIELAQRHASMCSANTNDFWVLEDGKPGSFGGITSRGDTFARVGGVITAPQERGHGYAQKLISNFLNALRCESVETAILTARSPSAIRCYEKMGFVLSDEFAHIRLDNRDAQDISGLALVPRQEITCKL
jgi:GNAT superfamily N-acetyltransferase